MFKKCDFLKTMQSCKILNVVFVLKIDLTYFYYNTISSKFLIKITTTCDNNVPNKSIYNILERHIESICDG